MNGIELKKIAGGVKGSKVKKREGCVKGDQRGCKIKKA